MRASMPHGVDLRGFHSRLAPLRDKLHAELQSARCSLGDSKLKLAAVAEQVRQLHAQQTLEANEAMQGMRDRLDAVAHRQLLRHLVHVARQCTEREEELERAESVVSDRMQECVERDRRLAVVQRIQDHELRAHAALVSRRQHREADLLWLARAQGSR
jgi:hypothetical protein